MKQQEVIEDDSAEIIWRYFKEESKILESLTVLPFMPPG